MSHIIKSVNTNDNLCLEAMFIDGTVKQYDIHNMFPVYPKMEELEDKDLFDKAQVNVGGYGIFWNDELDLDAETIWAEGITVRKMGTDAVSRLAAYMTAARKLAGVTQKQLSEKTGIYQSDISRIEHGQANPSLSTLQRLADGMDMELNVTFTKKVYSDEEAISEVQASLRLAGMELTEEDLALLWEIKNGTLTSEEARQKILKEV